MEQLLKSQIEIPLYLIALFLWGWETQDSVCSRELGGEVLSLPSSGSGLAGTRAGCKATGCSRWMCSIHPRKPPLWLRAILVSLASPWQTQEPACGFPSRTLVIGGAGSLLLDWYGWESVFYFSGLLTLLWVYCTCKYLLTEKGKFDLIPWAAGLGVSKGLPGFTQCILFGYLV